MRSDITIAGGMILFAALVIAGVRPSEISKTVTAQGIVTEVYETGLKDLVVKLKGHANDYYLDVSTRVESHDELREKLLYKNVVIQYPDRYKSPDNETTRLYISKVEQDGEIVYED